jgi:hypothetical protein
MTLGNWGQSLLNGAARTLFGGPYLRDFQHASKTFRPDSYSNAPKLKFLFHTYFEINPEVYRSSPNFGILVKEVRLPSFTMEVAQMNQYNRKRLVQSKIKYDPIEIVFHDDNGNSVNRMWEAYYQYYYNDGNRPGQVLRGNRGNNRFFQLGDNDAITSYNSSNIYTESDDSEEHSWGLKGGATNPDGVKVPFFKNITVFGLNQHNFTAYTLINPLITSFSHDTYDYNQGSGIMQNKMTIDYETVVYNEGALDGRNPDDIVTGFGDRTNYDRTPSPNMALGANGTILGRGGLIDAAGGAIRSLQRGNIFGAADTALNLLDRANNPNFGRSLIEGAAFDLGSMFVDAITNSPSNRNRNTLFSIPGASQTPGLSGLAGSPTIDAKRVPPPVRSEPTAGDQFTGNEVQPGFPVEAPFGGNFNAGTDVA